MKLITLSILIFSAASLISQPTITNSVTPVVGTSSTFRLFDPAVESPGSSGAMVTWDFSNYAMTGSAVFSYLNPSAMPDGNKYPLANLGLDQSGNPQVYLKTDNQQISIVGFVFSGINEEYNSNPKELVRFPITYGNTFTDSFAGVANLGTIVADREGTISIEADAYGTLILPYTTFNNVLRVRNISIYDDILFGNVVNSGIDTVYTWYVENQRDYIVTWSHIQSNLFGSVFFGAYQDTMFVGMNERHNFGKEIHFFPNPATDQIFIDFYSDSQEDIWVRIYESSGREVRDIFQVSSYDSKGFGLDVSPLQRGLYYINVSNGSEIVTGKLMLK